MDLGVTDKVKPLIAAVRDIVRNEVIPVEEEFEAEIGKGGNRFEYDAAHAGNSRRAEGQGAKRRACGTSG